MFDFEKAKLNEQSIEILKKESFEYNFQHISYEEKLKRSMEELIWVNPYTVIKWGWDRWDDLFWWIYWGKIYAIWWETWTWKSTFLNQIANNLAKQKVKVTKYSLEDRLEDIGIEELFYTINKIRREQNFERYQRISFVNNEYWFEWHTNFDINFKYLLENAFERLRYSNINELDKKKQAWIDDLVILMEQEANNWTRVFFIDHLHYFKMEDNNWRTDLEIQIIMHKINEVARKFNVAIFLIAHYRKLDKKWPDNDSFKDASAIKQVANVIIHIKQDVDEEKTIFDIAKIRWPIKKTSITWKFNLNTYSYTFE